MKRFTETDKWKDTWFRKLKPSEKLLWIYILDNCNNAGFFEFDPEYCCFMTNMSEKQVLGAMQGLNRGLIGAKKEGLFFVKNFLRHQKNDVLNPDNNAHKQIIRIINEKLPLFDDKDGAIQGLLSPIGKVKVKEEVKVSFNTPSIEEVKDSIKEYAEDKSLIVSNEYCGITAEGFIEHYENCNWRLNSGRGSKMKNWKLALKKFIRSDYESGKIARSK